MHPLKVPVKKGKAIRSSNRTVFEAATPTEGPVLHYIAYYFVVEFLHHKQ